MQKIHLFEITTEDKKATLEKLIDYSTPTQSFFFFIILSIVMAAFGLLNDNTAVVIGSMLIAPVLYPILSLGMGIAMSDGKLMSRSTKTLGKSILIAFITSLVVSFLFAKGPIATEIVARTTPNLIDVAIAVVAGLAASIALVKPRLNESIPGIAISVSLVPPLTMIGIGLADFNWSIFQNATLLFLVNLVGIIFTSVVVFSLMNFYGKKTFTDKTIKEDDKAENLNS
ncbi:MAG: TIGR00341 family protein [Candidatus Harrisonbacteria bacterium CG10_big_fil_rev_8_21_14_0_10_38_8]|uniref:TIGR00341 family protein n=1 Tax=Candidatus Harrisonbacteria bacterium CG10_big_fil_rev_8_21_14_0_10_38_8 TaxID=1974582 RepID=A0A2M6WJG0_9BACT|nr:MAG: TIGR00341 family protein [Candidatus Harrisonbacteria bacterium CG10_big_fil_rev_8_21_14_0_10_38_8]